MTYLIRVSRHPEDHLEKVPLEVALQVEQHLQYVAALARVLPPEDISWLQMRDAETGLFRYQVAGYTITYELDHRQCIVELVGLKKNLSKVPQVVHVSHMGLMGRLG